MRSDEFMNVEEVARYLHLGKNTVYQLAKTGKLASYHVGREFAALAPCDVSKLGVVVYES